MLNNSGGVQTGSKHCMNYFKKEMELISKLSEYKNIPWNWQTANRTALIDYRWMDGEE